MNPSSNPIVDLIVLSRADTDELRAMTQTTISTAIANAEPGQVNVIVMEQVPGVEYEDALTVRNQRSSFNYNWTANAGAMFGQADWVMIANNDLLFAAGWLAALLDAGHAVVSPVDPGNARQRRLTANETGYETGVHLSGWCFMLHRQLLDEIGGLDDRLSFWCSDDATIEQLRAVGIAPMVVPTSRVYHLVSQTLHTRDDQDDLTWGQVHLFNQLYDRQLGQDNPRYRAWLARRRP